MASLGLVEVETTAGHGKQCRLYSKSSEKFGEY